MVKQIGLAQVPGRYARDFNVMGVMKTLPQIRLKHLHFNGLPWFQSLFTFIN